MRKYWHVLQIGIQNTLVYRTNFFIRALFNLVPLLATVSLWQAIYAGRSGGIAGYTLAQMVSYYVVVIVVDALTAVTEDDWQIAADIKDGMISQFVVKPMDYLAYRLSLFISGRLVYTLAAAGPVVLFILLQHDYLVPAADCGRLACFFLSVVLSALLQFLLSYTVAMLAFWVLEISTFVFILLAFERVASGQMFPLDLLPSGLAKVLMCTPFAYQSFFPVSIYMGRVTGLALAEGLLLQGFWVAVCYGLARWAWNRGLKCYSAVGG